MAFFYYYGAIMFALTEAIAFMWIVEKVSKPRKRKEKHNEEVQV